ncbi:hypothetical protein [Curvivirga sp.]|uniref:LpxL/LpxP family acyltransferase n=1 Tax=Curvivirga sp. TaxID=2856848 RepID=UPI003B5CFBB1
MFKKKAEHWATIEERGAYWGLRIVGFIFKLLGTHLCFIVMQPVLFYFFLTGKVQRQASIDYLNRLNTFCKLEKKIRWWHAYQHFCSFAYMFLDKIAAWTNRISIDQIIFPDNTDMEDIIREGKGVVVLASHFGNIEVSRALAQTKHKVPITVFAHTKNAIKFNKLLTSYNPEAAIDMVEVNDLGPGTAIDMQERLEQGHWIVIAADRVPVEGEKRVVNIPFLGNEAPFPEGGIILAALLKAPVYMMMCVREKDRKFKLVFEKLDNQLILPRKSRQEAIITYLRKYAELHERYCLKYPYQWYNFFDFWKKTK